MTISQLNQISIDNTFDNFRSIIDKNLVDNRITGFHVYGLIKSKKLICNFELRLAHIPRQQLTTLFKDTGMIPGRLTIAKQTTHYQNLHYMITLHNRKYQYEPIDHPVIKATYLAVGVTIDVNYWNELYDNLKLINTVDLLMNGDYTKHAFEYNFIDHETEKADEDLMIELATKMDMIV
jgi:hypothetical protein